MKKVAYIIFDNFEEVETIVPVDLLRRAGAIVELITLNDTLETTGRSEIKVLADKCFKGISSDFDMIALSGGAGVFEAIKDENLLAFLKQSNEQNKEIAAICAAPLILQEAGLLADKKCTGHTSIVAKLGENYLDSPCIHDGNICTSQGAGTAFEFAFELIKTLFDEAKAKEVSASICYKYL